MSAAFFCHWMNQYTKKCSMAERWNMKSHFPRCHTYSTWDKNAILNHPRHIEPWLSKIWRWAFHKILQTSLIQQIMPPVLLFSPHPLLTALTTSALLKHDITVCWLTPLPTLMQTLVLFSALWTSFSF